MISCATAILIILMGAMLIAQKNLSWWHLLGVLFFGLIWDALLICDVFKPKKSKDNDIQLLED